MWGNGGRVYWQRGEDVGNIQGIVVIFAWISSKKENLIPFVHLYSCLGWNALICHADFVNLCFSEKAKSLSLRVVDELAKEIKIKPYPIVFAAFSDGSNASMYKVLQIIESKCKVTPEPDCKLVRDCISGCIFDSCPIDITSDLYSRIVLSRTIDRTRFMPWIGKFIASCLDTIFLNKFEEQRANYWQILCSSSDIGPILILCSENDDHASYQIIYNFAQHLQELGGYVNLVKWKNSPHVGHYAQFPVNYKACVSELLRMAILVHSRRTKKANGERKIWGDTFNEISESVCDLRKAAICSNQSLTRVATSSMDNHSTDLGGFRTNPSLHTNGVLGKILFDVCVPKNVEGWDIKPCGFLKGHKRSPLFNPIRHRRRSRL